MPTQIVLGVISIAMLYYGADFLVRGGTGIAKRMKISPLVIGLTLVACATSAPEMVVSVDAAIKGLGGISLGNIIGSNICNIALILGFSALITPLEVNMKLFKLDVPLMNAAAITLAALCLAFNEIGRVTGAIFLLTMTAYTLWSIHDARKTEKKSAGHDFAREYSSNKKAKELSPMLCILFTAGGLAALTAGGKLFVNAAVYFAELWKVPDAVIGLTVVAVGTSLPELATSAVAAFKGEKDIATGNVVGSNIFNILGILGVAPIIRPINTLGISGIDLAMLVAMSMLLVPVMYTGKRISRPEGAGLLLIYAAYTAYLVLSL